MVGVASCEPKPSRSGFETVFAIRLPSLFAFALCENRRFLYLFSPESRLWRKFVCVNSSSCIGVEKDFYLFLLDGILERPERHLPLG